MVLTSRHALHPSSRMHRYLTAGLTLLALPLTLGAQHQRSAPRAANAARVTSLDSSRYAASPRELRGLRWRLVGPFRGGRAVAVTGDPADRNTFYFGS